jgi:uncharacterized protein (TIGR03437 family)
LVNAHKGISAWISLSKVQAERCFEIIFWEGAEPMLRIQVDSESQTRRASRKDMSLRVNGRLFAAVALCAAAASLQGQTLTTLASFDWTNGSGPASALMQGADGNFYGTTQVGGAFLNGNVFKLTPGGTLTSLYNFCSVSYCADGQVPITGLVQGTDGNFYGTAYAGGANSVGTVFKLSPGGALTTLYAFCSQAGCSDGDYPDAGLIQASDGNFYGTTEGDGNSQRGTAFKITPQGTLTTLYSFCSLPGCMDGEDVRAGLIQASDGNFYGTTNGGGGPADAGTVFKMTPSGKITTLHSFSGTDGTFPSAALIQASDGNFYGTTTRGGAKGGGTVFKITPGGTLTTLFSFSSSLTGGATSPRGALVQARDGNLYGTTQGGGDQNNGTVFMITVAGALTTLYSFCYQSDCSDGKDPVAGLIQATDGSLYGTTYDGGADGIGAAFRLQPAASAPYTCTNTTPPTITSVDSASAYGGYNYFASGSWLEIKGTNLADPNDPRLSAATNPGQWTSADFNGANAPTSLDGISVSINGKPAYVWYLSPTQLNVQAPEDSTTGNVAITVTNCKATSSQFEIARRSIAPGLLAPSTYTSGGKQYLITTFASDGAYVLSTSLGASFGLNSRPAKPGDVIIAYGIGFGDVTPSILPGVIAQQSNALTNPVAFSFGSTSASLEYSGLAGGFVGLYEFYITVPFGLANGDYEISVTQNGVALPQTLYLTVQSTATATTVQGVTLSSASVTGAGSVTGTVTLSAPAPAGGASVALFSNSSLATVPASVTIPAGSSSATFSVSASSVSSSQTVTITASYSGSSASAALGLSPSVSSLPFPTFTVLSGSVSGTSDQGLAFSFPLSLGAYNGQLITCALGIGVVGIATSNPVEFLAGWNQPAVNGLTVTCQGLEVTDSIMESLTAMAQITTGTITFTLNPQVVSTSGTISGSFKLVSTIATVSGSFAGTYIAQ